ncbi:MAG TPA: multidrug efflux RND transporter permease subunit [Terriglobales bacterium]|nr:multidrug efflux RND transporter permease subunit [Terriglobales bacterium]
MFVDFFIRRPIFASVCALIIILAGAVSIPTLPVAQYPNLAPPTVNVTANFIGASAQEVESAVTLPLEEAINGAEGLQYITSSSSNSGMAQITCTFDVTRDIDLAAVDVQNRISTVTGLLPPVVQQTGVTVTKANTGFLEVLGFYSDHNQYSNLFISNYVDVYVTDALKRVPGVANVVVFGQRTYAMRIWLDPLRLAGRGLTASDVIAALQEQNVEIAAGAVGQPPAPSGQAYQFSVRAAGRLTDPAQFDNIVLKTDRNGTIVKLSDVGYAQLGAENYGSNLEYNGVPTVGLAIQQLSTANAMDVAQGVNATLAQLAPRFPPGLHYITAVDSTEVVRESMRDVLITLLEAIIIVIVVIFLFLQDWRTTLIPSITIPVALIGTFAFIRLFNFSINTLTMFGIVLATGLVVDDAIVVIENVERHISEGVTEPHRAASIAMSEVTSAVIATSLVLIAVFVPVALFPGTTGILFRQFALTIAFSIAISAFNALTLSPALAALLLREHHEKAAFWKFIQAGIEGLTHGYRRVLHGVARWRWVAALAFLGTLVAAYFVFLAVPRGFIPTEDQGYIILNIQAPPGASLSYTGGVAKQAMALLRRQPEVLGAFAVTGFSFAGGGSNTGLVFVRLKPYGQRVGPQHSSHALVARLQPLLFGIPGATVVAFEPPPIPGIASLGGFQFEVLDQSNATPQQLYAAAQGLIRAARSDPKLTGMFSGFTANDPQIQVNIDRDKAKALQVPINDISAALQTYLGSAYVNQFDFNNRSYRVYVQAEARFRDRASDINEFYVRSGNGQMVPLRDLVQIENTAAPQVINHYDLFRSAEIDGSAAPGYSSGQAISEMEALARRVLPQGMSFAWTGLALQEIQSGSKALLLFVLGLLVVYLTLSAQYESWVLPFIVMLAVPAALLGALGAQAMRGLQDDIYCQIGLVMLIGLSTKNAILIVEFAEQLRDRGLNLVEAAIEAGRIRLRPILMTSIAFMLGILPLVVASGAGSAGRHSVGTAVFGGMLLATILNLFFIPALYLIVRSVFHGRSHRHGAIPPGDPEAPLAPQTTQ